MALAGHEKRIDPQGISARTGISLKAFALGLVLVAVVCLVVSYAELVVARIQVGFLQMPPAVLGIFFLLVVTNRALAGLKRSLGLSSSDLMMIYCMMLVAAMISSRGVMEKIIPLLVTPSYFANQANRWQELFFPHIKKWMVPFSTEGEAQQPVSTRFFEGLREGEGIPWSLWAIPLAVWGILILLMVFAFVCLAAILRRQWVDNEKLSFPLVQPPLELVRTDQERPIFKNRLFWGGAALPALIFTLNGLHNVIPAIPAFPLQLLLNDFLVDPPWSEMYCTWLFVSFAAIGFFFFLPSDLLFAIWFFAIFARMQGVLAACFGWEPVHVPLYGTHQFVAYQTAGAYFVLVGYLVYVGWPHLKRVVRGAFGDEKIDDAGELLPYRTAVWGLLLSFVAIIGWGYLAGMSVWVALLEFGVFLFIIALVMARSTAEAGMLMTETSFRPIDLYRMFAPVHALGAANMTALAFFDMAFLRDQRGLLLTGILDGLKISDGAQVRRKSFLAALSGAILFALVFAGALQLWIPYSKGGITLYEAVYNGHNLAPFKEYGALMLGSTKATWDAPVFFGVGVVFTVFLSYMRTVFYWWPFHPLGYALCVSWAVSNFWFSALLAWMTKALILRYGGMRLYTKGRPLFMGLIIGEFGMAVAWTLITALTGITAPEFPWP